MARPWPSHRGDPVIESSSTIGFDKKWNPMLSLHRDAFVAALCDVPAKPSDMMDILRENEGRRGS